MRYLKTFKNAEDIQVSLDNGLLGKPYLAKMENSDVLDFNTEDVTPYETRPLTMRIISGGTLFWSYQGNVTPRTIYYSKDFGETWTSWTSMDIQDSGNTGMSVSAGDIIQFKGDNDTYSDATTGQAASFQNNTGFFDSTALFDVYGNIMSLIDSENFAELDSFPVNTHHNFAGLFASSTQATGGGVRDASNLILPATALTIACYACMFFYNTDLEKAPTLPAATLLRNSYNAMFGFCSNLKYIKCLATDISAAQSTGGWVRDVSGAYSGATGTFVKSANASGWTRGYNGVPYGWDVINEDETPADPIITYFPVPIGDTGTNAVSVTPNNGKLQGNFTYSNYSAPDNDGFEIRAGISREQSSAITYSNAYLWGNVDCICGVYKDDGQGGYEVATQQDPLVVTGVSAVPMFCNCSYVYDFETNNLSAYTSDNNYTAQERCEAKGGAWDSQNRVCLDCEDQGLISDGECGCIEPEE